MAVLPRTVAFLFCLALLLSAGWSGRKSGSSEGPGSSDELREVGQLIASHTAERGRGPKKLADLAKYEAGGPLGYEAIRSGKIIVLWGATMAGEGEGASATAVVAHEKN